MAKYQIRYSCGHAVEKQLFGPEKQRANYRAWAETTGVCESCAKASHVRACEAIEAEHDLPALVGSDKQVAWARSIRAEIMTDYARALDEMRSKVPSAKLDLFEQIAASGYQLLAAQSAARYWIDNKDRHVISMLDDLKRSRK